MFAPGPDARAARRARDPGPDAVAAAFVATLDRAHHFKRLDVAIEGLARAQADVHLIVAGGGELLEGFPHRGR